MKVSALIFPHQLFHEHPALKRASDVWLYEHPRFFTDFTFHKQKLILHRASMKAYAAKLQHKIHVRYAERSSFATVASVMRDMKKHGCREVHIADVNDHKLEADVIKAAKAARLKLVILETPCFLITRKEASTLSGGAKSPVLMAPFYAKMRKKFKVLLDASGGPAGGQWSFDAENRKRLPKSAPIPELHYPLRCENVSEAFEYVQKNYKKNPGHTEGFMYPVTHAEAAAWLEDFLRHRLAEFGDYEDAIAHDEHALFHSVLSPLLNIGLLTPHQVIDATLRHARRHPIRLNCLEGFLRHVLGWREYVRALYETREAEALSENTWKHKRSISKKFVNGTTGMLPVDTTIAKVHETAYCHHTERLTILGNYLLLTETKPEDISTWFMENFIDAYDWVVKPNLFLMIQKPSITSSNYIRNMSDYPGGEWEKTFDALFWRFLSVNETSLEKNVRLSALFEQMKKSPDRLAKHIALAEGFLKKVK